MEFGKETGQNACREILCVAKGRAWCLGLFSIIAGTGRGKKVAFEVM